MKFGRVSEISPDGPQLRLVLAEPESGRVIDLARAYSLVLRRRGASAERAAQLSRHIFPSSMAAAISTGDALKDFAHEALAAADDASTAIDQVAWRAAVDAPVIRDGLTFEKHITNFAREVTKAKPNPNIYIRPGYFKGSTGVSYGHDEVIPYPDFTDQLDYELEIGYVVGKPGRNLTPEEGLAHVFGITIFNDFSARDLQAGEMAIGMGPQKCKDFAYGIGPWITTLDEVPQIDGLAGQVRVNGEVWSDTRVEDMVYTPDELVAYVSIGDNLQPGDIIGSGTLGFGSGLELGRKLNLGDVIELEVDGIGTLRSPISTEREKAPWWPAPRHNPHEDAA